jgi:hypothetical protein
MSTETESRKFRLAGGENNGLNGTLSNGLLRPVDFALRLLGSKVEASLRAAGGSIDFWERYLRYQMGISATAAERFLAIPRAVDATLIAGAGLGFFLAPNRYPQLQTPLRFVATIRAAYQATQLLPGAVVGSYATAMAAAAALRFRCPNNPHVAKAIEFLNQNPQAKYLLITWYAATCASLIQNGHRALIGMMNQPQPRPALQTVDMQWTGKNPAEEDRANGPQASRFNNADLAKAVDALETSRMSQTQLHAVARLAIARGKENRATEEALWKALRNLSVQSRKTTEKALAAAQQEFVTASAASNAEGAAPGPLKKAADLAEMKLKKLQIDVMNREVQNISAALQERNKVKKDLIAGAALQSAINLDIFPLLNAGIDVFIAGIPELVTKYGQKDVSRAVRPIMNCLKAYARAPGGVPEWSDKQVNAFMESVETGQEFNRFQARGAYPINAAMTTSLAVQTYQLSVAAHTCATAQRAAVEATLPAGAVLQGDPALQAVGKQEAVRKRENASDVKLSKAAVQDFQTITDITRTANQSYNAILYPDLTVMYTKNAKELWLSQVRREGASCRTTKREFQRMLSGKTSNRRTDDGNTIVYFKINPDTMLDLVLKHDIKKLDFEECFQVTGLDSGFPVIDYDKPTDDPVQQRLDHRLTAELFRVVGMHHMSSILKVLASGNLHAKQPEEIEKIEKQLKFLDWINKNHFVTEMPNGAPSFMTDDRHYMNHAEAFEIIRQELAFQLSHRAATIATTKALEAKRGREPQPEVAWAQKRALSETMATLKGQLEKPHWGGLWSTLKVSYLGNNLRCRAFVDAFEGLFDSANALKAGLDGKVNTHEALRLAVVSAQEGHRPLLESFYRHAFMLKHMLKNEHVLKTVLPTFSGNETSQKAKATQLLADIKAAVTSVNTIFADYVDKVEFGAPGVHATETLQLKETAKGMAKIFANADFFLNGFERQAPTLVERGKMALAGH